MKHEMHLQDTPFAEIKRQFEQERRAEQNNQSRKTEITDAVRQLVGDSQPVQVRVHRVTPAPDVRVAMKVNLAAGQELTPEMIQAVETLSKGVRSEQQDQPVTVSLKTEPSEKGLGSVRFERVEQPKPPEKTTAPAAGTKPAEAKQETVKPEKTAEPVQPEPEAPEEPLQRRKHTLPVIQFLLAGGIVAAVIISIPQVNYLRAGEMLKKGEYEQAAAVYQELGTYKNASEMAQEAYYRRAMEELDGKHWETAAGIFQSLGDYKNSSAKALECIYQKAEDFLDRAEYRQARELFLSLEGYSDSANRAQECIYLEAEDFAAEGNYQRAAELYGQVPDFRDAAFRASQSRYSFASGLMEQKDYEGAAAVFELLGGYSDSRAQLAECNRLAALSEEQLERELEPVPGKEEAPVEAQIVTELEQPAEAPQSNWRIAVTVNGTRETLADDPAAVEAWYQEQGAFRAIYHIQVEDGEEETLRVRYEITYEDGTQRAENWDGRWRVGNVYWMEDVSDSRPVSIVFFRRDTDGQEKVCEYRFG